MNSHSFSYINLVKHIYIKAPIETTVHKKTNNAFQSISYRDISLGMSVKCSYSLKLDLNRHKRLFLNLWIKEPYIDQCI